MEGDSNNLMNGLMWIGGGVISLLSVIGIGSIILALLKRRWDRTDRLDTTLDANHTAQIDADKSLAQRVFDRMDTIEERLNGKIEKLESDLASQRDMNIRKDEKIKHLEEENQRLRQRTGDQDKLIASLQTEIDHLKDQMRQLQPKPTLVKGNQQQ